MRNVIFIAAAISVFLGLAGFFIFQKLIAPEKLAGKTDLVIAPEEPIEGGMAKSEAAKKASIQTVGETEPAPPVKESLPATVEPPPITVEITAESPPAEEPAVAAPPSVVSKSLSWQKENGVRMAGAISSATIFKDNQYWMYYTGGEGIRLARSADGLSFQEYGPVVRHGFPGSEQEFISNPAVFHLNSGQYRLIYEGSQDNQMIRKLYSAISNDGLAWVKEDGVRLEDSIIEIKKGTSQEMIFTSVPDMIRLENDCLRIYYAVIDEIRTAQSCDEGLSWEKEGKIMFDIYMEVSQDPDIIRLKDGTYQLFFSAQNSDRTRGWVMNASSGDGRNFKVTDGKTVEPSAGVTHAMDVDVVRLPDGRYRLYYSEGDLPNPNPNILSLISQENDL